MPNDKTQSPAGRKSLKSFAGGIAHKFHCSCEHYAWMAYQLNVRTVSINLMTLQISPPAFTIDRNLNLARMCQDTLYDNAERRGLLDKISSAMLHADFGIDGYDEINGTPYIGKSCFKVTIADDRGKEWTVDRIAEKVPVQP